MPSASDEQTWWSIFFTCFTDPTVEIPGGIWELALANAFDIDTPQPPDDLLPHNQVDICSDEPDDIDDVGNFSPSIEIENRHFGDSPPPTDVHRDDLEFPHRQSANRHDSIDD